MCVCYIGFYVFQEGAAASNMAKVRICNVDVLNNPAAFLAPFKFEVTFECIESLSADLEWKLIYVGSAESERYDQTLDTVLVGPVVEGRHRFCFDADPPDPNLIPVDDVIGVTIILLICEYHKQEFLRIGYYLKTEYSDEELRVHPPDQIDFEKLIRTIQADEPRVTRFRIDWSDKPEANGDDAGSENTTGEEPVLIGHVAPGLAENDTANEPAAAQPQRNNSAQSDDSGVGMDNVLAPEDNDKASG